MTTEPNQLREAIEGAARSNFNFHDSVSDNGIDAILDAVIAELPETKDDRVLYSVEERAHYNSAIYDVKGILIAAKSKKEE